MDHAGRAIAGMGGQLGGTGGSVIAGAGSALAVAGRAVAELGGAGGAGHVGGSSSASAQLPGDGLPNPRWVLRDKSGTPLNARVWEGFGPSTSSYQRFGTNTPTCVRLDYLEARNIGLAYELKSGKLVTYPECSVGVSIASGPDWRSASIRQRVAYTDPTCSSNDRYLWNADMIKVGETIYVSTGATVPSSTPLYGWNGTACTAVTVTDYAKSAPLPSDITGLLSNPPYSLELVY